MERQELRDLLLKEAWKGRENSYSPYSNYKVGAAVMGIDGKIYRGCNIENTSYGLSNCAERTAMFNMVSNGCQTFTGIAIVGGEHIGAVPCGACRQVMTEFCESLDTPVYVSGKVGEILESSVREMLPHPFLKDNLTA